MDQIKLYDLHFKPFLDEATIRRRVESLGRELEGIYADKRPIFLGVLNGAFIFAADLLRACNFECELSFIKLSSYSGTGSSGDVVTRIGLESNLEGRHVVIVEDIIDSGLTMHRFLPELHALKPASVAIVALLVKPEAMEYEIPVDFHGFDIPVKFVVGYGLDYNGLGRNLKDIYELVH